MTSSIKQPIVIALTLLLLSISTQVFAARDNLLNFVEYPIKKDQLFALSLTNITLKLCSNCSQKTMALSSNTLFYENRAEIEPKKAIELYVKRDFERITVFIDHKSNTIDAIKFGNSNSTSDIKD